jgi:hypothetical protein
MYAPRRDWPFQTIPRMIGEWRMPVANTVGISRERNGRPSYLFSIVPRSLGGLTLAPMFLPLMRMSSARRSQHHPIPYLFMSTSKHGVNMYMLTHTLSHIHTHTDTPTHPPSPHAHTHTSPHPTHTIHVCH